MAFIPISGAEIATGEPTASTTATKIKDNFDNHEARIVSVEGGGNVTYPPLIMRLGGYYDNINSAVGIEHTVTAFAMTITGARIYLDKAGTSGTTQVDLQVSSSGGAYASIFTTKPSVLFSAGDSAISSNAILDVTKSTLAAGDVIRLDLTSSQFNGKNFFVRIDYIKI